MDYVNLGRSGLRVSRLCLGCMSYGQGKMHGSWTLNEADSLPFFRLAIEKGINFFDTADAYGEGASEIVLGKALKAYARRDEVVIATKFFSPTGMGENMRGASRKHITAAVEASLKRLQVDYIDLYIQHFFDTQTPLEETLQALDDLVRAGKVLYIGASNFKAWQLAKAIGLQTANGWRPFTAMQVQYNLIYREEEREMIPLCQDQGIGITAWSSLARGFLAGNRTRDGNGGTPRAQGDALARQLYFREPDFKLQEELAALSHARGVPPMQIALAWIRGRAGITAPIVGATQLHQLEQAVEALDLLLSDEEIGRLEGAYVTRPPSF